MNCCDMENDSLRKQIQTLRGELQLLSLSNSDIYHYLDRLKKLQHSVHALQADNHAALEDFSRKHEQALQLIQFYRAQCERLRAELKALEALIQQCIKKINDLKKQLSKIDGAIDLLKKDSESNIAVCDSLLKEKEVLALKLAKQSAIRERALKESADLRKDIQTLFKRRAEADHYLLNLQDEAKSLRQKLAVLNEENQDLRNDPRLKGDILDQLNRSVDAAQAMLSNLQLALFENNGHNNRLRVELLSTAQSSDNQILKNNELKDKIVQAQIVAKNLQNDLLRGESIEEQIKALENENGQLQAKLQQFRFIIQSTFKENNQLAGNLQIMASDDQTIRSMLRRRPFTENAKTRFEMQFNGARHTLDTCCQSGQMPCCACPS